MKALILSVSTGEGHHATGVAIKNQFEQLGVECTLIDAFEYIDPKLSKLVSKTYSISAAYAPKPLASIAYDAVVNVDKPSRKVSATNATNTILAWDLKRHLEEFNPDIIICTHVMSSMMAHKMKEKGWTDAITVGIVTDFTVHPMWQDTSSLDYYVVASELLELQMAKKGLSIHKVLPFGIPIRPKFSQTIPQSVARTQLNLEQDRHTVLIMSGSMGHGRMDKVIESIDDLPMDFQVMVVCGSNKDAKKKIDVMVESGKLRKDYQVYGYVDNVDVMMDAADCIVTKPGGITSSEALAKGLPMIMINPIPGWEVRNAEFMLNNGIALYATKSFPLDEAMFSLLRHDNRLQNLRETIALYSKKDSTKHLCEFLIDEVTKRSQAHNDEF
ncbi:MAG: glycosyltransferase [Clostridiales Family XIII bacterium]|jgi:processive 1,2-diacylglycerol beta-glucosyltransferase|nr:glycosyltransferase [Clostridiales Family XIII bacterium]